MENTGHDDGMTTLASFETEQEAAVVAALLDDAGIPTRLLGGHLQSVAAMLPGPRVQLVVRDADAPGAAALLEEVVARLEDRELALDAQGCCASCGHDMSDRPGQEICRACGINLRQLARQLRSQQLLAGVPAGGPRVSGPVGRWVARAAIVFVGIPCLILLSMLVKVNPVGLAIAVAVTVFMVIVLDRRKQMT